MVLLPHGGVRREKERQGKKNTLSDGEGPGEKHKSLLIVKPHSNRQGLPGKSVSRASCGKLRTLIRMGRGPASSDPWTPPGITTRALAEAGEAQEETISFPIAWKYVKDLVTRSCGSNWVRVHCWAELFRPTKEERGGGRVGGEGGEG